MQPGVCTPGGLGLRARLCSTPPPAPAPSQDCEQHELALGARLGAKQEEADELDGRAVELEGQVELKRGEGDSVAAARAAVVAEFEAYVADKAPHVEALTAIFHRCAPHREGEGRMTAFTQPACGSQCMRRCSAQPGGVFSTQVRVAEGQVPPSLRPQHCALLVGASSEQGAAAVPLASQAATPALIVAALSQTAMAA